MGEKPVFSTRAHVFQIDPQTKKNWKPASKTAIPVAFYHDPARKTYRIISVDGGKPLVNSTITPNMNFTKTSPKFGQWTDARVGTIYGLGFSSEAELNKFSRQFEEAKTATKTALNESGASSSAVVVQRAIASPTGSSSSSHSEQSDTGSSGISNGSTATDMGRTTPTAVSALVGKEMNNKDEKPTANGTGPGPRKSSISGPSGTLEGQLQALKYENDRLKIALATSSSHGKKWELEMQTLKNNNAKLTTALQESLSHVEEWKKQLKHYEEESASLKQRVQELEAAQADVSSRSVDATAALTAEKQGLEQKVGELQGELSSKQQELSSLSRQVEELSSVKAEIQSLQDQTTLLEEEKAQLSDQLSDAQDRLQLASVASDMRLQQLAEKHREVGQRLQEALNIHHQMEADLK